MAEELRQGSTGYKIWRNPTVPGESPVYLGEFYPPEGQFFFTGGDLRDLGLGPGTYSVLAPDGSPHSDFLKRWQRVVVPE
jgi:hypothetical protein